MKALRAFITGRYPADAPRPWKLKLRSHKILIIVTLHFAIFTDIFLYGVVVPVLPFALSQRAGVEESSVQSRVSTLLAVYGAALFCVSPLAGWYADRSPSRRLSLLLGLLALAGGTLMLCLATTFGGLVAGRLFQGAAAGVVWTVGAALLIDTVGQDKIAQAMGWVSMTMNAAYLLGPLLGGVVYAKCGYYAVYGMAFTLIALDIILRLLLIEKKVAKQWDGQEDLTVASVENHSFQDILAGIPKTPNDFQLKDIQPRNKSALSGSPSRHAPKRPSRVPIRAITPHRTDADNSSDGSTESNPTGNMGSLGPEDSNENPTNVTTRPTTAISPPRISYSNTPTSEADASLDERPLPPSSGPRFCAIYYESDPRPIPITSKRRLQSSLGMSNESTQPDGPSAITRASKYPPIVTLPKSKRILAALWGITVQGSLMTSLDAVIPLFVQETFNWSSMGAGATFLAIVLPSFTSPWVGKYSDKHGPRWLVVGGFLFMVPFWVALRVVTQDSIRHKVALCGLMACIGFGLTLVMPPLMAEMAYVVEAKQTKSPGRYGSNGAYASAYGLFVMSFAAGCLIGPLWAGSVRTHAGWGTMSWSLGLFSAVGAVPCLFLTGGLITRVNAKTAEERTIGRLSVDRNDLVAEV